MDHIFVDRNSCGLCTLQASRRQTDVGGCPYRYILAGCAGAGRSGSFYIGVILYGLEESD